MLTQSTMTTDNQTATRHAMTPNEEWGLNEKVAIATGGGAADDGIGNGRAPAILLARTGAKVLVVDGDLTRAERTVSMIAAERATLLSPPMT
jgi:hypothetical protein